VALIGSGNISETHARAAIEARHVELVAHWGRNAEATQRLARRYGGRAFDTVGDLLAHRPLDAVLIGTPSGTHADFGIAAARAGVHVLVEKPLDVTTARIDPLLGECAGANVTLGVFFQDRTAPDLVWLKQAIDGGDLGAPLLASASVRWYRSPEYYAGSPWRGTRSLDGGGALMNQGIHTVDLLLWLFGPVVRVSAIAKTALHQIEVEDTVVATLEFANGALGTLEVTTAAYPGLARRIELTGSRGTIIVEGDRILTRVLQQPPAVEPPNHAGTDNASASSPVVSDATGHQRVIEDFVAAVRTRRPPRCDGAEGRRSVALIEAIYQSADAHTPLAVR
jgi:predicted dehydrogenase